MADYKVIHRAEGAEIPWEPGCPVALTAMQVSRNTETSECWLQAKARNVSGADASSIYAVARLEYADGTSEELPVEYLDADVAAGSEQSLKPRRLPRGDVRSCELVVTRVEVQGEIWESVGAASPLPAREKLALPARAAEQRAINLGIGPGDPAAGGKVRDHGGWWACACGQVNVRRDSCCACRLPKAALVANEVEARLLADADERDEKTYAEAVKLQEQGTVESLPKAIEKFESLGNRGGCVERAAECKAKLAPMKNALKRRRTILATCLVAAIAVVLVVSQIIIPARKKALEQATVDSIMQSIASSQVGQTVDFGAYEQDNNESNGKEPITWKILAIKDNRALLISDKVLDCHKYFEESFEGKGYIGVYKSVNYETSDLASWLKGDFCKAAFESDAELSAIDGDPFCLSDTEAETYFTSGEERICFPTDYAKTRGVFVSKKNGSCSWWLSSPLPYACHVKSQTDYTITDISGGVVSATSGECSGSDLSSNEVGVRPAIWVNL